MAYCQFFSEGSDSTRRMRQAFGLPPNLASVKNNTPTRIVKVDKVQRYLLYFSKPLYIPLILNRISMATIRLSTKEVQVDDTIYVFDIVQLADAFEACVATVDAAHCELDHRPVAKRPVEAGAPSQSEQHS